MIDHIGAREIRELADYITRKRQTLGTSARTTELSPSGISNWKHPGRKGVPPEVILDFCLWEGVSMDWLLFGEGPKYRRDAMEEAEAGGHTFDLRTVRVLLEAQEHPELVRAIEQAVHNENLRRVIETLPRAGKDRLEIVGRVLDL